MIVASDAVLRRIDSIIDTKPSVIALVGEAGRGKSFIARYLAKEILGLNAVEGSPFVTIIDGVSSGIDDVRNLQKELYLTVPQVQSIVKRIVIIVNFDGFKHEAQNALLKTLEEPPTNTIFILTINNDQLVLGTILSRSQTFFIPPISYDTARTLLPFVEEVQLKRAFYTSSGNVGALMKILNSSESSTKISAIEFGKDILSSSKFSRISRIDKIIKSKEVSTESLVEAILMLLHASASQAAQLSDKQIAERYHRVSACLRTMKDIQSGANVKLALTNLFIAI